MRLWNLLVAGVLCFAACSRPPKERVQVDEIVPPSKPAAAEEIPGPNIVKDKASTAADTDSTTEEQKALTKSETSVSSSEISSANAAAESVAAKGGNTKALFEREKVLALKNRLLAVDEYVIKWEDIVHSDVMKNRGGSPLFHFYLTYWSNRLDLVLKSGQMPKESIKELTPFCLDPDCLKGLDTAKINPALVHLILYYTSQGPLETVTPFDGTATHPQKSEALVFLSGALSFPGWGVREMRLMQEQIKKKIKTEEDFLQWKRLNRLKAFATKYNVTEFVVNLPHQFGSGAGIPGSLSHYDVGVFIELGRFIKKRKMDLRIVGGCGPHCANYLLPAAKTVIIEPYGYIYTEGSIHGLLLGGALSESAQRDYQIQQIKERLPVLLQDKSDVPVSGVASASPSGAAMPEAAKQMEFSSDTDILDSVVSAEGGPLPGAMEKPSSSQREEPSSPLVQYVTTNMLLALGRIDILSGIADKMNIQTKELSDKFVENLTAWGQSVWGTGVWQHFKTHIFDPYQRDKRKSFREWTKEDIKDFIRSMDNKDQRHFLEELAIFMRAVSVDFRRYTVYLGGLDWLWTEHTQTYHQEVGGSLLSQVPYTYDMLLDVIPHIVRDVGYDEVFLVPKTYYAVPERDKPYVAAPSAGLLRLLGMNVVGENNRDALQANMGDKVLYLNEKSIQNCEFFKTLSSHFKEAAKGHVPQPAYTRETFNKCLLGP